MVIDGRLCDKITPGRLKKTGRNPTDRCKQGVKRSLMTDANGLPLPQVVAGANTHDIKRVADTLDGLETVFWLNVIRSSLPTFTMLIMPPVI
ncbi:Uncharacterised protein [Yersinia pseudotuberculosis]|uniref:Transposase IS4-like domain-containing protein n=1 Tax=Yersinia pseudotuberculosis TaxID=633 RepID=A0A380Q4X7_YERPU|nr:Uncharacterised protein [Yersinia pseudotuberculosis]